MFYNWNGKTLKISVVIQGDIIKIFGYLDNNTVIQYEHECNSQHIRIDELLEELCREAKL